MSTIAEREAAARVKVISRLQQDRSVLLEAVQQAVDALNKLEGVEIGAHIAFPLSKTTVNLKKAIAQVENRKEATP